MGHFKSGHFTTQIRGSLEDFEILLALQPKGPGRGPDNGNFPKVVRRGCKRSFGPRAPKASCTGAIGVCTGANQGLGGAKDSEETLAS